MAGELVSLLEGDALATVTVSIHYAIQRSLEEDLKQAKNGKVVSYLTSSETKRRFDICLKIVRICRGDLKWSVQRICDNLFRYLQAELNGDDWAPSARMIWTPS